jgi:hypothetical protein
MNTHLMTCLTMIGLSALNGKAERRFRWPPCSEKQKRKRLPS